jgi:hypothetical protein
MATDSTLQATAGDLHAESIIEALNDGQRVIIEKTVHGQTSQTVREFSEGVYRCQTPVKPHTHETENGLRICLINLGHAAEDW